MRACACALLAASVAGESFELFPAGAPGEVQGWPGPEATYDDRGFPGVTNVSRPTITTFIATNNTSGAAVIVAPGGGYSHLALGKEGTDIAKRFNELGLSAFVLKYRVPISGAGHFRPNAPLQDAQRAMGIVRNRARDWGLNISRIGFVGFSAGGDLASLIAGDWDSRHYARVDAADDVSCRPDFSLLIYPGTRGNVKKDNPPAFIAQAADDPAVDPTHTAAYFSKLVTVGGPSPTMHMYPKGRHGFGICQGFPNGHLRAFEECCEWPLHALRFLQDWEFVPGFPSA